MCNNTKYVLGIDSAVQGCGACVYNVQDPSKSVTTTFKMNRGQAEALVPCIRDTVAEAGIVFDDIGMIATTLGPGTFTGLRVGLSAAKSFSLALDVPIIGFSTLDVIAQDYFSKHESSKKLCVLLESRREDYYCQIWDDRNTVTLEASALICQEILDVLGNSEALIIGDAIDRFQGESSNAVNCDFLQGFEYPNPDVLSEMAIKSEYSSMRSGDGLEPIYLRGADVSLPKSKPRKLED